MAEGDRELERAAEEISKADETIARRRHPAAADLAALRREQARRARQDEQASTSG